MTGTSPPPDAPTVPTQPKPPPPRRLVRRVDDRVVAGVASGMADYLQIDPVLVRIAFVVLALTGGVGVVAYLAAWLLMPEPAEGTPARQGIPAGSREPRSEIRRHEPRFWVGVALIVIAAALVADELWRPGIVWPLALIGIGLLLLRREPETTPADERDPPTTARTAGSEVAGPATPRDEPAAQEMAGANDEATHPRRPRSMLGRATLAIGLVIIGFVTLLDTAGMLDLGLNTYLGLVLAIMGGGLLVGAWWGRSAVLIVLGALIVPALVVTSLIDVPLRGDAGAHVFRPSGWHEVRPTYELAAGELTLNLTDLDTSQERTHVEARVGVGEIQVVVPAGVAARVEARAGAGDVHVFGTEREGLGVELVREVGPAPPQLWIFLEVGTGEISVRSASR
ncbi:MAG: PspC domain-containing protein [Nitriliruptorales bacterium]